MNIKRDLEFLFEIGSLRFLNRQWRQFSNADLQNISEHIFRVIWISLILAKYEKVRNMEKILKMALIHDLPESRTGDFHYLSRFYVQRNENKAIADILNDTAVEEFRKIWEEYEKKHCIEAKIVKDADVLDCDFELKEQEMKGDKLTSLWKPKRKKELLKRFYTKTAKKLWKEIYSANPHFWHFNAANRHKYYENYYNNNK